MLISVIFAQKHTVQSYLCIFLFIVLLSETGSAQSASTLRSKNLLLSGDTIVIDSLSIQSGTFRFIRASKDSACYELRALEGILVRKKNCISRSDSIAIQYRVYPVNFTKTTRNKERRVSTAEERGIYNPFIYTPSKNNENLMKFDGLTKSGSISRGISVGNNQDLSVSSSLNLQLSGKLADDIDISAAITDDNIPIQPDGNTQQLQDFDKVYIQLSNASSKLIVGDFQITRPESYFMNFNKRLQGGSYTTNFKSQILNENKHRPASIKIGGSMAVARGRFNRNQIQAVEGNQGPYRLKGANNEQYIVILSGSEKVYIDGRMLKRGQEFDYIIDYNAAELSFTSRVLITKDIRIFVEFEYSDRNYARSLIYANNEIVQGKFTSRINMYSEQDSKNQPLQQKLTAEEKAILRDAGDDLPDAFVESIDSIAYSADLIMYLRKDTLVNGMLYQGILKHTTNPDSAKYTATFSNVGALKGNYKQTTSAANGRVFEWIAPVNDIPQGSFEPKAQLIPSTKKQILTVGSDYRASSHLRLSSEIAYSKFDKNTFSTLDSKDDQGYAFRIMAEDTRNLGNDSVPWKLVSAISYEQIDKNFSPIERFRNVEFERDWNLRQIAITPAAEYLPRLNLNLSKGNIGSINYLFTGFSKGKQLNASQHNLTTDLKKWGYVLNYKGSITRSSGTETNTLYYRHKTVFTKDIRFIKIGYQDEYERNLLRDSEMDTLTTASYKFFDRQAFIQNLDTAKNKFALFYKVRTDNGLTNRELKQYAWGESYGFTMDFTSKETIELRTITSVRNLKIRDSSLTALKPERTLLNRIELSLRFWKSSLVASTFYEVGSGLETRKEFSYLEVQPGQGVYAWTDYNSNGIRELNEFELSAFPDQARYIRVFTQTQDFIRVFSNQFNQILNLKAPQNWSSKKGFIKLASRFSTQSALKVDGRTTNSEISKAYNPFGTAIEDPQLITANQSFRNSVFFNKNNPKFGFDLNWQQQASKALLNNGLESRENQFGNHRIRWSPGDRFNINGEFKKGRKTSNVTYFSTRNYQISYLEFEPRITFQPNAAFRLSVSYKRSIKNNKQELGGERASTNTGGIDLKYNVANKGSFQAKFNLIFIDYTGINNTPVAYEMQEGLRTGKNYTWGLSYQRTLSNNMQINVNYDGRKSPDVRTVHVGGVQVRVFF
jgi:hypothetical protein